MYTYNAIIKLLNALIMICESDYSRKSVIAKTRNQFNRRVEEAKRGKPSSDS